MDNKPLITFRFDSAPIWKLFKLFAMIMLTLGYVKLFIYLFADPVFSGFELLVMLATAIGFAVLYSEYIVEKAGKWLLPKQHITMIMGMVFANYLIFIEAVFRNMDWPGQTFPFEIPAMFMGLGVILYVWRRWVRDFSRG